MGSSLPHLHQDLAHRCHICAGTGLTPPTSAPGLALSCSYQKAWRYLVLIPLGVRYPLTAAPAAAPKHTLGSTEAVALTAALQLPPACTGTGLAPATSAPVLTTGLAPST